MYDVFETFFFSFPMFRRLLIAHQKLTEGSFKKHEDKSSAKTDLAFECKFFFAYSDIVILVGRVKVTTCDVLGKKMKATPSVA